jgi:hypothetical protein
MLTKRFLLTAVAFLSLLPFTGCGCRKSCCSSSSSMAPPAGPCCDKGVPPGYLPPPVGP